MRDYQRKVIKNYNKSLPPRLTEKVKGVVDEAGGNIKYFLQNKVIAKKKSLRIN